MIRGESDTVIIQLYSGVVESVGVVMGGVEGVEGVERFGRNGHPGENKALQCPVEPSGEISFLATICNPVHL